MLGQRNRRPGIDISVGSRLKQRRQELGLDADVVARDAGIDPAALVGYENGTRRPRGSQLMDLAAVLGVRLSYFFTEAVPSDAVPAEVADGEIRGKRQLARSMILASCLIALGGS